MLKLQAATVLLQWSAGGLAFGWVTTRRREVGIGYGWSFRVSYGVMAVLGLWLGRRFDDQPVRDGLMAAMIVATAAAGVQSWTRRKVGVRNQRELAASRTARVAAMTGIDRQAEAKAETGPEFDPRLDLVAPLLGLAGLVAAGFHAGTPLWLQTARLIVGAGFLGAVSDGMLLGHWYLVQPGLRRAPLTELVVWTGILWVPEVVLLMVPPGMMSVFNGSIDDGYNGMLGWFWIACVIATIILIGVTLAALRERQYSAVMAATGLMYLAILTAFGTDLVARALLVG